MDRKREREREQESDALNESLWRRGEAHTCTVDLYRHHCSHKRREGTLKTGGGGGKEGRISSYFSQMRGVGGGTKQKERTERNKRLGEEIKKLWRALHHGLRPSVWSWSVNRDEESFSEAIPVSLSFSSTVRRKKGMAFSVFFYIQTDRQQTYIQRFGLGLTGLVKPKSVWGLSNLDQTHP